MYNQTIKDSTIIEEYLLFNTRHCTVVNMVVSREIKVVQKNITLKTYTEEKPNSNNNFKPSPYLINTIMKCVGAHESDYIHVSPKTRVCNGIPCIPRAYTNVN